MLTYVLGFLMVTMAAQALAGSDQTHVSVYGRSEKELPPHRIFGHWLCQIRCLLPAEVIVIVVVNDSDEIVDYYEMKGRTVF